MRKQATILIPEGKAFARDAGKTFLITEMPATQAEKWATRALMALAKSGVDIPEDVQAMGMAAIATLSFQALSGIVFGELEPLLDEMWACVKKIEDPTRPEATTRALVENDTEEVATILMLRKEVFELHTGFFAIAGRSTSKTTTPPAEAA